MQRGLSQYNNTGLGFQYNNTSSGVQYNNIGLGQSINYGRDQNINQHFGAEIDSRRVLWDAIKEVGFSHQAEQQFSRGECLEGTREEVLRMIHGWRIPDGWEPPICWLSGAAGVGKTSIAMTFAKSCEADGLVTSFFCFRIDAKRNNPSALMLAIAHGLAVTSTLVREEITDRIRADWSILGARLEKQFQELVVQPVATSCARQIAANHCFAFNDPTLIIIDGLDECGDEDTQLRILSAITSAYQQFPRFPLRFLICSRPEAWIREAFEEQPLLDATKVIVLDDEFEPDIDIERYYIHEFQDIRRGSKYRNISFPDPWPSKSDLAHLVQESDGQFAHASTAIRFVRLPFSSPLRQLRLILANDSNSRPSRPPFHTLDSLYSMVLHTNPNRDEFLPILAAILIIKGKTSPDFIELLFGLAPGDVSLTLRALHSVLDIRGRSDGISVFHTSFVDYLYDPTRSGDFYINKSVQHDFLVQRWLQALSSSRIGSHDLSQVASPDIHMFVTKWYNLCSSLRGKPTTQVLESLRDLDFCALFFSSLSRLLQDPDGVTVTAMGHLKKFAVCKEDWFSHEDGRVYKQIEGWLESDNGHVDPDLINRFANHSKCFLFHVFGDCDGIEIADIHQAICSISFSDIRYKITSQEREASLQYNWKEGKAPLLIQITECYCRRSGIWESTSYQSVHCLCQPACLQLANNLAVDLDPREPPFNKGELDLDKIFTDMLDCSLLEHCAFGPDLFVTCETFLSHADGYASWESVMTPVKSASRHTKLMGWLETCPASYAREADALKFRLNIFFAHAFDITPAFYDNMLKSSGDHDRLLPILGAIFTLPGAVVASPAVIESIFGLPCGEVSRILQLISEYVVVRGQEDKVLIREHTFIDHARRQSGIFGPMTSALRRFLAQRWLQTLSRSRMSDQYNGPGGHRAFYELSTRLLYTEWINFCIIRPGPTSDMLDNLRNLDLGALFLCRQVMHERTRLTRISQNYDPTWNGTFGKIVSWLEPEPWSTNQTLPVDSDLIERFKYPPKCFHLNVSDRHDTNVLHWVVLNTIYYNTVSTELTRRAKEAFLACAPWESSSPFAIRINDCSCRKEPTTDCSCHDDPNAQCQGHCAYQAACLGTMKAFVSEYCFPETRRSELYNTFRNMLDSSLLAHCAFGPELFSACHTFLSALESRPPPPLTITGWTKRRAKLLEWLQTCPEHYVDEADALKSQVMSLFPEGTLKP